MKTVTREALHQQIDQLVGLVAQGNTRALIEDEGRTVAASISAAELERFQRYEDVRILEEFGKAFEDQTPEQIEREAAKALREARAERRKKHPQPRMP